MSNEYYCIDRIEDVEDGNIAVVECPDLEFRDIPVSELPRGVKEGDCLKKNTNGEWIIDDEEKKRRLKRINAKLKKLMNKNNAHNKDGIDI